MSTHLTHRQREILELVRTVIARTGVPPTRNDICQALGFKSHNAAEDHLQAIARKGFLTLTSGMARGIRITDAGNAVLGAGSQWTPLVRELGPNMLALPVVDMWKVNFNARGASA